MKFSFEKMTKIVVFSDEHGEIQKSSFEDFFDKYISNRIFSLSKEEYSSDRLLDFLSNHKEVPFISFCSDVTDMVHVFSIDSENDEKINVILTVKKDERFYKEDSIDYLTNISSRKYLFRKIKKALKEENDSSYLFMIDLDNFKQINDSYGHLVGDECLREIAGELSKIFEGQLLGRYGGDEFLAFAKNVDNATFEKMVNGILSISFRHEKIIHQKNVIRCSVGIVKAKQNDDIIRLIEIADGSLYQAKEHGKNIGKLHKGRYFTSPNAPKEKKLKLPGLDIKKHHIISFDEELKSRKKMSILATSIVTLILGLSLVLADVIFSIENKRQIKSIAQSQMQGTANSLASTVEKDSEDTFMALDASINMLNKVSESADGKPISNYLSSITKNVPLGTPGLLLSDDRLYLSEEISVDLKDTSIAKNINHGTDEKAMAEIGYANIHYILHAKKYDRKIDDQNFSNLSIKAVVCASDLGNYSAKLFSGLDSKIYAAVVSKDGSKIFDKTNSDFKAFQNSTNILSALSESGQSEAYDGIKACLDDEAEMMQLQTIDDVEYIIYDTSIQISTWHILVMTSYKVLSSSFSDVVIAGAISFNTVSIIAILLLLCLMLYCRKLKLDSFINKSIDPITQVINEQRFLRDGREVLLRGVSNLYLVYINIKKFKFINGSYGSTKGDDILRRISKYLHEQCEDDELMCREYSDHFIMMINAKDDDALSSRVRDMFARLLTAIDSDNNLNLSFNIGFFSFREDSSTPLWKAIDRAKHACEMVPKSNNYISYRFFDKKMLDDEELTLYIEKNQDAAFQNEKFIVYYQGKYDLKNDRFGSAEALVRWKDDRKGFINTQTFIDAFEKNGFVVKLDLFVFERVLKDIKEAERNGKEILPISINISRKHFDSENSFLPYEKLMKKYEVDGKYLIFEITESVILNDEINLQNTIERIHSLGSRVSIDDFGSGFSNFALINHIDYDELKMDKRLLNGKNGFDEHSRNVLKSIIRLNRHMNKTVVCEGVEDKEEADFLRENGCDYIQGYYYAKPMPKDDFINLLEKTNDR